MKRLSFLKSLLSLAAAPKEEPRLDLCPVDKTPGDELGAVVVGMDGVHGIGDPYWPNTGWYPTKRLMSCPKCRCLFWMPYEKK